MSKLRRNHYLLLIAIPVAMLLSAWLAVERAGALGVLAPMVIGVTALSALILEFRNFQLGLFMRRHESTKVLYDQLEAYIGLNAFLRPVRPLPRTRGWAASPDLLREIVYQLHAGPCDLVVEASSGTSTIVVGYCMKQKGTGRVIALEHDAQYAERTRQLVRDHGLQDHVEVIHAPLMEQEVEGRAMLWYDLTKVTLDKPIDLLLVDGPPDTVQAMARFPAFPLLKDKMRPGARVLLDDGNRPDEKATAERWARSASGATLDYLDLEAGAWLLRTKSDNR